MQPRLAAGILISAQSVVGRVMSAFELLPRASPMNWSRLMLATALAPD